MVLHKKWGKTLTLSEQKKKPISEIYRIRCNFWTAVQSDNTVYNKKDCNINIQYFRLTVTVYGKLIKIETQYYTM